MRKRGSALLYVLVVVVALSVVVMALASFGTEQFRNQVREERATQVRYAFEGALAQIRSDLRLGSIEPPETRTVQIGGLTSTVTVTDNAAALKNTYKVVQTINAYQYSWKTSAVIGASSADISSVWYWALVCNSNMSIGQTTATGSIGLGDMFVNGNLNISASNCSVDGDFYTSGNNIPSTLTISGRQKKGQPKIAFPPPASFTSYTLGADSINLSSRTISLGTFSSSYYTIVVFGDVNLSGTYTGTGVIYATGDVTITGNVAASDANSRISIIAAGQVTIRPAVTHLDAICYAGDGFVVNGNVAVHGSLVGKTFSISAPLAIDYDDGMLSDPNLGYSLKLPGMWP